MEKLAVTEMINSTDNYYSLVVGIAKRAREIAEEAEEQKVLLDKKTVQLAMEEYHDKKFFLEQDGKRV